MRLLSLQLHSSFRGLPSGFDISFHSPKNSLRNGIEPVCLVGRNGSGKSNVLQVLAEIFYYLDRNQLTFSQLENGEPFHHLSFTIQYVLDQLTWELAQSRTDLKDYDYLGADYPIIQIHKKEMLEAECTIFHNGQPVPTTSIPLPRHVIGYSSGQNELISNPFIRLDMHYIDQMLQAEEFRLRENNIDSEESEEIDSSKLTALTASERNRLFYLDYESNKLITIANLLIPGARQLPLLYGMAGISALRSFSITINYPNLHNAPSTLHNLPFSLNNTINKLRKCATTWTGDLPEATNRRSLKMNFWVDEPDLNCPSELPPMLFAFKYHFRTADTLLSELFGLRLMNVLHYSDELREDIKSASPDDNLSSLLPRPEPKDALFGINDLMLIKRSTNQPISYRSLSDGEHQLLHIFGALMLIDQPGTLFLLDEPETHFNPEWRSKFVSLLNQIVEDIDVVGDIETRTFRQQEVLLTSHSPFIVSDCKPENVFVFKRQGNGDVKYSRAADEDFSITGPFNTFGASESLILEEVFNRQDSISELVRKRIDNIKARAETLDGLREGRQELLTFGESIEKFDALNYLNKREKVLLKQLP